MDMNWTCVQLMNDIDTSSQYIWLLEMPEMYGKQAQAGIGSSCAAPSGVPSKTYNTTGMSTTSTAFTILGCTS